MAGKLDHRALSAQDQLFNELPSWESKTWVSPILRDVRQGYLMGDMEIAVHQYDGGCTVTLAEGLLQE